MVGHTGKYEAAVKAATATDEAIGMVLDACNKHNYVMLVTADHGNCERMIVSASFGLLSKGLLLSLIGTSHPNFDRTKRVAQ